MAKIKITPEMKISSDKLNNNWMYKVSMSSLELFYSNFFECMFKENSSQILKALDIELPSFSDNAEIKSIIKREFHLSGNSKEEITDIMIGFELLPAKRKNPIILPYIIIENKVKSYPRNEQLQGQHLALKKYLSKQLGELHKHISEHTCEDVAKYYGVCEETDIDKNINKYIDRCHEVLLTYIPAHCEVCNGTSFKQILYKDFIGKIKTKEFSVESRHYVNDYKNMVSDICDILTGIAGNNDQKVFDFTSTKSLDSLVFYMGDDFKALSEIGFQDVFRKYQASTLEAYFKSQFTTESNDTYLNSGIKIRTDSGLNDKNGTTTFLLVLDGDVGKGRENLAIGVQLQRDQFRIMVVGKPIKQKIYDSVIKMEAVKLPKCIRDLWGEFDALQGDGNSKNKTGYNGYKPDCIYKYYAIEDNPTFGELKEKIKKVLEYIKKKKDTFINELLTNW